MSLMPAMFIFLTGLGSIYSGYLGYKNYRQIIMTREKVSILKILRISIQYGLASTLIFFALVVAIGIIDDGYRWSTKSLVSSLVVSSLAGSITFLGSIYQVHTTLKYRDLVIRYLKRKH